MIKRVKSNNLKPISVLYRIELEVSIRLVIDRLQKIPQIDNPSDKKVLKKYLPWSKELPTDILNFQGTYKELVICDDQKSKK